MTNEKKDEEAFPEIEDFEQEPFFIPHIYFLEESKSAEEFHKSLSKMICDVPKYNQAELEYLAEVVSKPWKEKRGRKPYEYRDLEIKHLYYRYFEGAGKPRKIKDFTEVIEKKYKLSSEAARAAIAKAIGPRRKVGEKIDDDLFP